jgi:hypothetical protein
MVVCISMFLLLCHRAADAAWTVQRHADAAEGKADCHLQSDTKPVNDGYQETRVTLLVQQERQ